MEKRIAEDTVTIWVRKVMKVHLWIRFTLDDTSVRRTRLVPTNSVLCAG